jgi:uncharacterized SAM-binding protein YcdF (DUF218 family)
MKFGDAVTGQHRTGLFPVLVFSGGNSPTTAARFPRGEAVHYAEHAMALSVPQDAIIVEPCDVNTGQNIELSRRALAAAGARVTSVMLISKPRAAGTLRRGAGAAGIARPGRRCGRQDAAQARGRPPAEQRGERG